MRQYNKAGRNNHYVLLKIYYNAIINILQSLFIKYYIVVKSDDGMH